MYVKMPKCVFPATENMTMNPEERIEKWKLHDSIRGQFGFELYKAMALIPEIYLITADLGYGLFDAHRADFPLRFHNVGASEQAATGICVGLALLGKIPFLYSITPFLLYRPFEWHRNYLNHEEIPVKLIGSGMDLDYARDGITHHACEAKQVLKCLPRIKTFFPTSKEDVPAMVVEMIQNEKPSFMALRR
jgi:transketolase